MKFFCTRAAFLFNNYRIFVLCDFRLFRFSIFNFRSLRFFHLEIWLIDCVCVCVFFRVCIEESVRFASRIVPIMLVFLQLCNILINSYDRGEFVSIELSICDDDDWFARAFVYGSARARQRQWILMCPFEPLSTVRQSDHSNRLFVLW